MRTNDALVPGLSSSVVGVYGNRMTAPFRGYGMERIPGLRALYGVVYGALAPKGVRTIFLGEISMRADFSDRSIVPSLWLTRKYEKTFSRALDSIVTTESRIVDVGAHIGYYAVRFAKRGAKVTAYEPHAGNRLLLSANSSDNGVGAHLEVRGVAVGRNSGSATLWSDATNTGGASLCVRCVERPTEAAQVDVVRLDDEIEQSLAKAPTILKIDVQGYESAVLHGACSVIEQERPTIAFEYNQAQMSAAGYDPTELLDSLDEWGYNTYLADEHRGDVVRLGGAGISAWCDGEKADGSGFANIIARHGSADTWQASA